MSHARGGYVCVGRGGGQVDREDMNLGIDIGYMRSGLLD